MNNQTVPLPTGSLRLEVRDTRLRLLKRAANGLIYASVLLGIAVLAQLYALMVPSRLFYSILVGWVLYLLVAVAVAAGREKAYSLALVLSIATLIVSLPRPEHYSLADGGLKLASLIFISGSLLQIGVIVLTTSFLILRRRVSRARVISVRQ
jgi:hypothetical protein